MAVETLSPETVYATKRNIAYPTVGASATAIAAEAQTRLNDAENPVTSSVPASAITVVNQ